MEFRIDIRKSVYENAQFYYVESKKARQRAKGAKRAIRDTQRKIDELTKKHTLSAVKHTPEKRKVRAKRWYEKFHWFYSSDNLLVVGGRDATTNDILIKKHLGKHDLVFHADIHGAPFFVVQNPDNREIPEDTLKEAAKAAASYSRAWKLGLGGCDVYYVYPEQVSKKAPTGEYLGKGAFMIHGKKRWFRGTGLGIGIGFRINDEVRIIGGPANPMKANFDYSVSIVTGDKKSGELAREIVEVILQKSKKEDKEKIKKVDLDEIQRLIPGGKGRVLQ